MKPLPNNILKCMPKGERVQLGKAGLTDTEAQAKWERTTEKKLQDDMEKFCQRANLFYLRMPMHLPTRIRRGWPDFTIFLPGRRALLVEIKTLLGKVSPDQVELHADYEKKTGDKVLVCRTYLQFITEVGEAMKL